MASPGHTSNFGKWMALIAALLGWLFDGLEMGLFPLVAKSSLEELAPGEFDRWYGVITAFFLVGAATGGVLFGWLGDRIGRVRSMMLSVLTYALVSGMGGLAQNALQLGILRFVAALGMGGEWSLGVALINEIWPDRSRAFLAGLIGAAANVGYLLIAVVGMGLSNFLEETRGFLLAVMPEEWVTFVLKNNGWRLLMMCGALPALLTFLIRLFVPESKRWEHEREKGSTSHWQSRDLLGVLIGSAGACGIIAMWIVKDLTMPVRIGGSAGFFLVALAGFVYPVYCFLSRAETADTPAAYRTGPTLRRMLLAAVLSGVALLGTWGTTQAIPSWAAKINTDPTANSQSQAIASVGAIVGTIVAALCGGWIGRRVTYFVLCIASFALVQYFYDPAQSFQTSFGSWVLRQEGSQNLSSWAPPAFDNAFLFRVFAAGAITASFYGWLPLYLPEIFRTNVRATGQGFAFNFGRILAAIGTLQMRPLREFLSPDNEILGIALACSALSWIYIVGMVVIWFVPETKGKPLPE